MADGSSGKGSFFKTAMTLLSVVMSLAMAFLLTAPLYNSTSRWVKDYAVMNYGDWTEGLAAFVWFIVSAFSIFAFFNLLAMTVIWLGVTFLASRGWIR